MKFTIEKLIYFLKIVFKDHSKEVIIKNSNTEFVIKDICEDGDKLIILLKD